VTSFWHQYLTDRDPRVPVTFNSVRICRLHQRQACKFGRDCNARESSKVQRMMAGSIH